MKNRITADHIGYTVEKEEDMKKMYVADKETGTFIEEVSSIEEGKNLISKYEEEDKENDIYSDNFYDVVDENHCSLLF